MILREAKIWTYSIPLIRSLTSGGDASCREGLVLKLIGDGGICGYGEIAPLPGFSEETLGECRRVLSDVLWKILGTVVPDTAAELSGSLAPWYGAEQCPSSLRSGIEFAVLSILASAQDKSISQLICHRPLERVPVTCLLDGDSEQVIRKATFAARNGYRTFKLKVARALFEEELSLVRELRSALGREVAIRLDANRGLDYATAIEFATQIDDQNIEFIEEPLDQPDRLPDLVGELQGRGCNLRFALDESLVGLSPLALKDMSSLGVIVIKPTLLGLETSMAFARVASSQGMSVVISSMFESGLGLTSLAQLAAATQTSSTAAGLGTAGWLEEDIWQPSLSATNGTVAPSSWDQGRLIEGSPHLKEIPREDL